jgi:hypothetical protein
LRLRDRLGGEIIRDAGRKWASYVRKLATKSNVVPMRREMATA